LIKKLIGAVVTIAVLVVAGILGFAFFKTASTIQDLLNESKQLRKAIANLTEERQVGYAKVISRTERNGKPYTRVLFVVTPPEDPTQRLLEEEFEVEGDEVHFDALVVRFNNEYVSDGRARALFLWRRVYGENSAPSQGFPIEPVGAEPGRYSALFSGLRTKDRELFWSEIWNLANDPERLSKYGVRAVYGNVVYKKMTPGLIYVFTVTNMGQVTMDTVPAL
jgi:hypothetical protein